MKITLSLSVICFLSSVSHGLVFTDSGSKAVSDAKMLPSHIIKLKASNLKNMTGFESTSFIKNHYNAFQGMRGGKHEIMGLKKASEMAPIKNIDIGQNFKAVSGSFHPSFVTYLNSLDDVEYIEPNHVYKVAILPTVAKPKPYSARQVKPAVHRRKSSISKRNIFTQVNVPSWGIARINRRDHNDLSSYTSDDSAGNGIHVYVFDSGINVDHPDFGGRAHMEVSFIDYEDDTDHAGHGTHVAGTIGGSSYGVAKNAILHGVKILDSNGDGSTSSLIQAISHIVNVAEPGRSIINLSLTGPRSRTIDDALSMAVLEHGIPIFVSAGNSADDACNYSPAANPDVFAVGASNQNDVVPSFSSYGECVRLYAPGTDITSAWLGDSTNTMDGTSMANPHVTGIAAMLMSEYEFRSASELYEALMSIATPDTLRSPHESGRDVLLAYNGADR